MRILVFLLFLTPALWAQPTTILGLDSAQVAKILVRNPDGKSWRAPELPPLRLSPIFKRGQLQQLTVENPRLFSGDDLWAFLDWAGESSAWLEVNLKGFLDPDLQPLTQGADLAWVNRNMAGQFILATLHSRGVSSYLRFALLPVKLLGVAPAQLQCDFKGDPQELAEFNLLGTALCLQKRGECVLVHHDDARLKAVMNGRRLRIEYHSPDPERLPLVPNFTQLNPQRQAELVADYRAYFRHEQSLAVRALLESTPGLWNWQIWHWLSENSADQIDDGVITEILKLNSPPSEILLFQKKCVDGRIMRITSNGQGRLVMLIE